MPNFKSFFDFLVFLVVRAWFSTLRIRMHDGPLSGSVIYAFWHEHIFAVVCALHRHISMPRPVALVSGSRDGRMLQNILRRLGFGIAVGSSSRDGASGFLALRSALDAGRAAMITPDGPRGPAGSIKDGVVKLSGHTTYPVVPVSVAYRSAWRLRSWDRAWLPKPFSSIDVVFHSPQRFTDTEADRTQLENALHDR